LLAGGGFMPGALRDRFIRADVFSRDSRQTAAFVATVCGPVAQSHHAPSHVSQAGWERCCAPIIE
jgi:hypothetical protein